MAVTITVEDGSGVDNANSYVSVDDARTYASNRGVTLDADDNIVGAQLIKAIDYLAQYRGKWKGKPVYPGRVLAWPRMYVDIDGEEFGDDDIPENLIAAQVQLTMAQHEGLVLLPNVPGGELPVIKEEVGPLKTTYAAPVDIAGENWLTSDFPVVDALLEPLLAVVGMQLRTLRV